MWQYNYSNPSDELYHWKYISKKRVNGKWVYTYPDDKLGVKRLIDTKITGKAYEQHRNEASQDYSNASQRLASATMARVDAEAKRASGSNWHAGSPAVEKAIREEKHAKAEVREAKSQLEDANYNYKYHSIKGVSEATIRKGRKKAAEILRKLADAID